MKDGFERGLEGLGRRELGVLFHRHQGCGRGMLHDESSSIIYVFFKSA